MRDPAYLDQARALLEREFPGDSYRQNPSSIDFFAGMLHLRGLDFALEVIALMKQKGQQRMALRAPRKAGAGIGIYPNDAIPGD